MALLGQLSALKSLNLNTMSDSSWITDETLAKLSSAPLVNLELDSFHAFVLITPEGLLQLTRACPTLRMVTLRPAACFSALQIKCGPGVDEGDLLRMLKNSLAEAKSYRF